jgi:hypothetical protein
MDGMRKARVQHRSMYPLVLAASPEVLAGAGHPMLHQLPCLLHLTCRRPFKGENGASAPACVRVVQTRSIDLMGQGSAGGRVEKYATDARLWRV